jgi:hypothetical protein
MMMMMIIMIIIMEKSSVPNFCKILGHLKGAFQF